MVAVLAHLSVFPQRISVTLPAPMSAAGRGVSVAFSHANWDFPVKNSGTIFICIYLAP
jgi:hypothetical protein